MKQVVLLLLIMSLFSFSGKGKGTINSSPEVLSDLKAEGPQTITPDQNLALITAGQGTGVNLEGFLTDKLPRIDYRKIVLPGPQYIISDDPEYIRVPEAIALRERVQPGAVRLYVYNVNAVQEPAKIDRKITAVIKNLGKVQLFSGRS